MSDVSNLHRIVPHCKNANVTKIVFRVLILESRSHHESVSSESRERLCVFRRKTRNVAHFFKIRHYAGLDF